MLYFGMSNQYDMLSGNLVEYRGENCQEYDDINQKKEEEKTDFSKLWDKVLGALPYVLDYTGGFLTGFTNSFLPFDFSDYSKKSDAFREGLRGGDLFGLGVGMALIDAGAGGMTVAIVAFCTGAFAPAGIVIEGGSGLAMGFGGLMMFNAGRHTADPKRYEASSSGGSGGGGASGGGSKPPKNERKYEPNPKHDAPGGKVSPNPFGKDNVAGAESLSTAYSSEKTKQLYNVHDGKIVKFQPDNRGGYHPYAVSNTATEVPKDVLKEMLNDGIINKTQYNKFIKNK